MEVRQATNWAQDRRGRGWNWTVMVAVLCLVGWSGTVRGGEGTGLGNWRPSLPKLKAPQVKMPKLKTPSAPQWAKKSAKSVKRGTKQAWGKTKSVVATPFQGNKEKSRAHASSDYRTARRDDGKPSFWGGWGRDQSEDDRGFETMRDFVGAEKLTR